MKEENESTRGETENGQVKFAQSLTQYALEHCKTPVACIRRNGQVVYANESQCQHLGYSNQELIGMSVADVDLDWPSDLWSTDWHRLKESGVTTFTSRHRKKHGRILPVEVTTNFIEHEGEEFVFAFTTDLSERKRAESELQASETKLRATFDHHYQLTGMLDCEGRLLAANKTALDFAGAEESDVLGQSFWETPWWDPAFIPTVRQAIQRAANGEFVRLECTHVRADGAIRDFDFSLSPVRDEEGNVSFLVPEGRDITELKQAERQLRDHDTMIRDIVETSRDWIWAIDLQGNHTYSNRAIETILGYHPNELLEKPRLEWVKEEDRNMIQAELPRLIAEQRGWNGLVLRWRHKNSGWRYLESNAVPIVSADGILSGFRGVDRDITDRLEAEDKLARMEAQLTHVARLSAIGEMMAGITHEVVQPLSAISNFARATANVLRVEAPPEMSNIRKWNDAIVNSAQRAEDIIARMRMFARRSQTERSFCGVDEIVGEAVQLISFEARSFGAKIHLDILESPPSVQVDRVQIQQVLVNLLRNALEAMDESDSETRDITIVVDSDDRFVHISVIDTGAGIPTATTTDIFEPFVTTKKEGLGLGLAISTSIIESHGGELWAESDSGDGATFQFTLPIQNEADDDGNHID